MTSLYRQLADDIRDRIRSGEYPVESPLPSTAQLMRMHRVSITVVRAAIRELQHEGLVVGQPGKGVYVGRFPESSEPPSEMAGLIARIESLERRIEALERKKAPSRPEG